MQYCSGQVLIAGIQHDWDKRLDWIMAWAVLSSYSHLTCLLNFSFFFPFGLATKRVNCKTILWHAILLLTCLQIRQWYCPTNLFNGGLTLLHPWPEISPVSRDISFLPCYRFCYMFFWEDQQPFYSFFFWIYNTLLLCPKAISNGHFHPSKFLW